MKTSISKTTTTAIFSDDGKERYLIRKDWNSSRPRLAIIMLHPSVSDEFICDTTTMRIIENAVRLEYGSVDILNLYSSVSGGGFHELTPENTEQILKSAEKSATVIFAVGTGKNTNKKICRDQLTLLSKLSAFSEKLLCIADKDGRKFYHPLCPAVREWKLSVFTVDEMGIRERCERDAESENSDENIECVTEPEPEGKNLRNKRNIKKTAKE